MTSLRRRTPVASVALVAVASLLAACAPPWPRYAPPASPAEGTRLGAAPARDSSRGFFDSLAGARLRDSVRIAPVSATRPLPARDSLTALAWLDILRDTVLVRLEQTAVSQNRDIQIAIARIREYRADVGVARAPTLPAVTANGAVSRNRVFVGPIPAETYNFFDATANVAWELDFWGRIRRGVDAANADLGAQEAAQQAAVLSLVSDVANGYLQVLELDQEREIANRTLVSRQATLDLARQRFAQGLTSELDVRQFEAQVAAPAVTIAQTERLQSQQEHSLSALLGEAPSRIPRGGTLIDAVRALTVPDSISGALLTRRPDVIQAERMYAAATTRAGIAGLARFPTVMITGSLGGQTTDAFKILDASARVYSLQAGISVPLFNNGQVEDQAIAARARADQARAQYEQVVLNALRDANDALVGVRTARDEEVAQETQAQALRQALDLAQIRYEAGLATYLDVLDAQRSLFTAELALSQAQLQQLAAAVQLYKALGGSWSS